MASWRLPSAALAVAIPLVSAAVIGTRGAPARAPASAPAEAARATLASSYDAIPLAFAPGEPGSPARFAATGAGYAIFLTDRGPVLQLSGPASKRPALLRTTLVGARPQKPTATHRLPGKLFLYHGAKKRENIPTFARVRYPQVYPGIDAIYRGNQGQLAYDFKVAPGADPSRIVMRRAGARKLRLAPNGDLLLEVPGGTLRESRPVAFQPVDGRRVHVNAAFEIDGRDVRFRVGDYDLSKPLVIDPELSFATYVGAAGRDRFNSISLAPDKSIWVAGASGSLNYPGTPVRATTDEDIVVSHLSADGKTLLVSTQVGGKNVSTGYNPGFETDEATDIAADFIGALVVGYTQTTDFAGSDTTLGSCAGGGRSGVLVWVRTDGVANFKRCFGGNSDDTAESVALRFDGATELVDVAGTTRSTDGWGAGAITGFKSTPSGGARDDAFVMEVNLGTNPHSIRYRTFMNGNGYNTATGVAADSTGIYITGGTNSSDMGGVTDSAYSRFGNAYVAKIALSSATSNTTTSMAFLKYFGTAAGAEAGRAIALGSDAIYVVGNTDSDNLPSHETSGNLTRGQGQDGFIAKFSTSGVLSTSTYVGGDGTDSLEDIAVQSAPGGNAEYVIGTTDSDDSGNSNGFTTRNPVPGQSCTAGDSQALLVKRVDGASPGGAIISCLGGDDADGDFGNGIAVNPADATDGTIYVAGTTGGNFPGVNGYQTTFGGADSDGWVAKLAQKKPTINSTPPPIVGNTAAHLTFSTTETGMSFSCSTPVNGTFAAGVRSASACPTAGSADYADLADGDQTFEVVSVDAFGSRSQPATTTFTVDKTPPAAFDAKSPGDNESTVSGSPIFSWAPTTDLHGVVSYALVVDDQALRTVDPSVCVAGTCSTQAPTPIGNGKHTWKIVASDGATPANTRASAARTLFIGNPLTARLSIAPNPALVGRPVTFDASASSDATHTVTHYEWDLDGDGAFETDTGGNAQVLKTYATPGTFAIGVRVSDDANNLTATTTQELKISFATTTEPVGVSINKGAQYTNTPNVKLSIVPTTGATSLLVANDGGFVGALPQSVAKEVAWKLDSSGPERLPKTVYVRFLINAFASSNYTDDIILDERPPVVDSASVASAPAASRASASKARTWRVKVKARDSNSGVGKVQVAIKKTKPGRLIAYKRTVKVKLPTRPKFVRARDKAGNFSKWKKLR